MAMAVKVLSHNPSIVKEIPESLIWNNESSILFYFLFIYFFESSILDLKALALKTHCFVFVVSHAAALGHKN